MSVPASQERTVSPSPTARHQNFVREGSHDKSISRPSSATRTVERFCRSGSHDKAIDKPTVFSPNAGKRMFIGCSPAAAANADLFNKDLASKSDMKAPLERRFCFTTVSQLNEPTKGWTSNSPQYRAGLVTSRTESPRGVKKVDSQLIRCSTPTGILPHGEERHEAKGTKRSSSPCTVDSLNTQFISIEENKSAGLKVFQRKPQRTETSSQPEINVYAKGGPCVLDGGRRPANNHANHADRMDIFLRDATNTYNGKIDLKGQTCEKSAAELKDSQRYKNVYQQRNEATMTRSDSPTFKPKGVKVQLERQSVRSLVGILNPEVRRAPSPYKLTAPWATGDCW